MSLNLKEITYQKFVEECQLQDKQLHVTSDNARPSPIIGQDADEEFQVEEILNSKPATSQWQFKYLVKWSGWPIENATKKPVEHLDNAKDAIFNFHEKYPRKPQLRDYIHEHSQAHRSLPSEGGG